MREMAEGGGRRGKEWAVVWVIIVCQQVRGKKKNFKNILNDFWAFLRIKIKLMDKDEEENYLKIKKRKKKGKGRKEKRGNKLKI